jgi:FtsH-binding integral membrane protein
VLLAWGLTAIVFLSLTAFCFQSKIDFSFMRGFLSCRTAGPCAFQLCATSRSQSSVGFAILIG